MKGLGIQGNSSGAEYSASKANKETKFWTTSNKTTTNEKCAFFKPLLQDKTIVDMSLVIWYISHMISAACLAWTVAQVEDFILVNYISAHRVDLLACSGAFNPISLYYRMNVAQLSWNCYRLLLPRSRRSCPLTFDCFTSKTLNGCIFASFGKEIQQIPSLQQRQAKFKKSLSDSKNPLHSADDCELK